MGWNVQSGQQSIWKFFHSDMNFEITLLWYISSIVWCSCTRNSSVLYGCKLGSSSPLILTWILSMDTRPLQAFRGTNQTCICLSILASDEFQDNGSTCTYLYCVMYTFLLNWFFWCGKILWYSNFKFSTSVRR